MLASIARCTNRRILKVPLIAYILPQFAAVGEKFLGQNLPEQL